jgi:hypothetical protein
MAGRSPFVEGLSQLLSVHPPQEVEGHWTCFDDQYRTPLYDHQQQAAEEKVQALSDRLLPH